MNKFSKLNSENKRLQKHWLKYFPEGVQVGCSLLDFWSSTQGGYFFNLLCFITFEMRHTSYRMESSDYPETFVLLIFKSKFHV